MEEKRVLLRVRVEELEMNNAGSEELAKVQLVSERVALGKERRPLLQVHISFWSTEEEEGVVGRVPLKIQESNSQKFGMDIQFWVVLQVMLENVVNRKMK